MSPRIKKIQTAVFIAALVLLALIWTLIGFKETWLFVAMVPVIIPNAWWVELVNKLSKKSKDQ